MDLLILCFFVIMLLMNIKGLKSLFPAKIFWIIIVVGIIITQGVNIAVNKLQLFGIQNVSPFSLQIDNTILLISFGVAFLLAFFTRLIQKFPLAFAIVGVGVISNLLEKTLYGYVTDYIKITWGYINLADLILWFGLILLNYEVWFNDFSYVPMPQVNKIIEPITENKESNEPKLIAEIDKVLEESSNIDAKLKLQRLMPKINKIKTVSDQFTKPESETTIPKIKDPIKPKSSLKPKLKIINDNFQI
jgi:lipoprotein signal peptidase